MQVLGVHLSGFERYPGLRRKPFKNQALYAREILFFIKRNGLSSNTLIREKMEFAPFIDPEPGALVQRYSWEIDSFPRPEPASEEFSQLHADVVYERNRRAKEIKDEIQRIGNISADRSSAYLLTDTDSTSLTKH